jgi:hypothetical protein
MEKRNVVETIRTPDHELSDRDDTQVKQAAAEFDVNSDPKPGREKREEVSDGVSE